MTQQEMLKIAYDRGVAMALEDEEAMTKEAFVGAALGTLGRGIAKGIGGALGSSKVTSNLLRFGKGGTKGSLLGGTFTGGMSAMGAEEGERGKAFAKGFLPGAVGFGPGWQLGSKITNLASRRGVQALAGGGKAGGKVVGKMLHRSRAPIFTQKRRLANLKRKFTNLFRGKGNKKPIIPNKKGTPMMSQFVKDPAEGFKTLGSKALTKALPFGGGLAGASMLETPVNTLLGNDHSAPVSVPTSAAIYHTGRQAMGRGLGVTPQQYYPRNY